MTITLRQMQYAVALTDTGHFGRAAERCNVTQPALSQQIRQLEDRCGASLFDRLGRSVRLTPLGREFIMRARPIVEQSEELSAFVAGQRGHPDRPLRFGMIPTVAPYLLPHVYPGLQEDLPHLSFTVHEKRTEALLAGLEEGQIDLALIASEPLHSGARLTLAPLYPDEFLLATGLDEPPGDPVSLSRLDTDRMLLLDEGHCFRDQAMAACDLDPEARGRAFAATSLSTIVEFVANGQGITLLPEMAVRKEAFGNRIHIHRLASPGARRDLRLVWRESSPYGEVFKEVAASIVRHRPVIAPDRESAATS